MNIKKFSWKIGITLFLIVAAVILMQQGCSKEEKEQHKLKVLAILPLSGTAAPQGEYIRNAMEMYQIDHPDNTLEIVIKDSQMKPAEAVSVLSQEMVQNKPDVVLMDPLVISVVRLYPRQSRRESFQW